MATTIAKTNSRPQVFTLNAPDAARVLLVGDFTQWQDRPVPMKRQLGGTWHATVALPPGDHHYRFIVDGEWRDDPECPERVDNPFGTQDAIRRVA